MSFYGSITTHYYTRFLRYEQQDQLQHERIHLIRLRAGCFCSTQGSTINLELEYHWCLPWLALALVLYRLPSLGLASSGCLVEILVEGPGIINTDIALLIRALTLFLVQHNYRGIPDAVG